MTKIVATRQAEAVTPAPIAIGAPSPAARALAFERGANIDSLMSQLRLALVEVRHAVEAMVAVTPPEEARPLQSFLRRLCLVMAEVSVFAPI